MCTAQIGGRPKKCVDKHVLEYLKTIRMLNAGIANSFFVHRNLVARYIKEYSVNVPLFTDYTNKEVVKTLSKILCLKQFRRVECMQCIINK